MEALLESDIAKLVLDYLKTEETDAAYRTFCKNSPYLREEYQLYKKGCTPARVGNFNLRDLLSEYFEMKMLLNNFCGQHADHILGRNLPMKLKHIIKLTQCKVIQTQPVFKKPATLKRRQSNETVDSDITATSTPDRDSHPPCKKQRVSSSFTMLNKSEPPLLHQQKGKKWTEQSDLEVPDTEDDETSVNNHSLVIDEEQEDDEQVANKTVIDNSILSETILQHDFQHIIASNINRVLQNMSNQSCENDSGIVGSTKAVVTTTNADHTGLANQTSLEAQLQFAMNNILSETENNPVFGDILNNLFTEETTASNSAPPPEKPDVSPIPPPSTKTRRKKAPLKAKAPTKPKANAKKRTATPTSTSNNILIEIPVEPPAALENAVTETHTLQTLAPHGQENIHANNVHTFKITGQGDAGETFLVTVPLYQLPNLNAENNEEPVFDPNMPIYIETMTPGGTIQHLQPQISNGSIPEASTNVEVCTTSSSALDFVDRNGQSVTLAQLAAAATASSTKKAGGITPEHCLIQNNIVMRKSMSTPRRKLSHVRILSFPTPSKRHLAQITEAKDSNVAAATINVDAIFNAADDDAARINDATISTTMETVEEIIVPVSSKISATPKGTVKNPQKCVRTLSRSASEDGSLHNEDGTDNQLVLTTMRTVKKKVPSPKKRASVVKSTKKRRSGEIKHIPISMTKSPASAKRAGQVSPGRTVLTRQKQANLMDEWRNMRQISKNNFDQHIRELEREHDLAARQAKIANKPPPQKRGRKPRAVVSSAEPVSGNVSQEILVVDSSPVVEQASPLVESVATPAPPKPLESAETTPEVIVTAPEKILPPPVALVTQKTSSLSTLSLLQQLQTPFKEDVGDAVPDTPRFLMPPALDTPMIRSIISQSTVEKMSTLKHPLDFPTPNFAITPGGAIATTTPKSTTSNIETTGEKSDKKTDYLSSGSSYYRPDESEDLDNRLDAMLNAERRRKRKQNGDDELTVEKVTTPPPTPSLPAQVEIESAVDESQSRETIIYLHGTTSNMAKILQQIHNSPNQEITVDVEANGEDTREGYARYRMLGPSAASVQSRDPSASSGSSYTTETSSGSESDSDSGDLEMLSPGVSKHPELAGNVLKKLKQRVSKDPKEPVVLAPVKSKPIITPAKLVPPSDNRANVALPQPTPEKIADLEEAAKQAALLEEKKARTVAILKKNAEKGQANRYNRSQGKVPSKIKTLMRGAAPSRPSPPPPKRKVPITRPAAIVRPKPSAAVANTQTPRKAVLLDTLVSQAKKKKTRKLKKTEESTLVDGEEFPKLSITPDRDEESLVAKRKKRAEVKVKKTTTRLVKPLGNKQSTKDTVVAPKNAGEPPLPKLPVVEEQTEDSRITEVPKEVVQVVEVSHTENKNETKTGAESKPKEPATQVESSSSDSETDDEDFDLTLSRSDVTANNRIFQAVVFDEVAFDAKPPVKAKRVDLKSHVMRLNFPNKPKKKLTVSDEKLLYESRPRSLSAKSSPVTPQQKRQSFTFEDQTIMVHIPTSLADETATPEPPAQEDPKPKSDKIIAKVKQSPFQMHPKFKGKRHDSPEGKNSRLDEFKRQEAAKSGPDADASPVKMPIKIDLKQKHLKLTESNVASRGVDIDAILLQLHGK